MRKKKKNKAQETTPEILPTIEQEAAEALEDISNNFETLYKETLDRYTRNLAEFDNFRKRSIKEKAAQYDDGVRASAEKLLPLIDNFERAMASGEKTHAEDSFYQGISLIARQFTAYLTDQGITEIPADPGIDFDPNLHNAVAHTQDDNFGSNQISDVLQKGYIHKEKVLRHSMVRVAN
ncbi:MAG: nucleotide exchange factor GrpE [Defluviitaleaceae bacterium]|nr:nucleotide exchange factor GrpE [Defluviitaleaceae bacterium]